MIVVNEAWTSVSHSRCTQPGIVCSDWRKSEQTKGASAIKVNGSSEVWGSCERDKKEKNKGREGKKKERERQEGG